MRALLERLVRELVEDGRAAASIAITLVLDAGRSWPLDDAPDVDASHTSHAKADALLAIPHRTITREVRPARPSARFDPLFDQCRALLEKWTIPAPIIGVTLSIPATAPLAADQGDLLIASWRDAAMNAEAVFARLRTALDPDNVGDVIVHPVAGDSHRPEHAAHWESADAVELAKPESPSKDRSATTHDHTVSPAQSVLSLHVPPNNDGETTSTPGTSESMPPVTPVLRLLDAPEVVDVEESAGLPDAVWWRGRRLTVTHADGPERLSGDWWREDSYARDYWRCGADGEGELLLYRETSQWYLQGWYD
jgi:hypothetical protein